MKALAGRAQFDESIARALRGSETTARLVLDKCERATRYLSIGPQGLS